MMHLRPMIRFAVCLLACSAILSPVALAALNSDPDSTRGEVVALEPGQGSPVVQGAGDPLDFIVDDGVAETAIGDNGQFIWFNRFTPAAGDFPFQLEQISVVFGTTGVAVGDAIELLVYSDTDGDGNPGTGTALVASFDDVVQSADGATFSVYNLATPVLLEGPGDVLIGVVNRYGSEGFNDFPARIDQTTSQGRSWAASYSGGDVPANPTLPADEQFGTIDSFGFPGNWIIRGTGTTVAGAAPAIDVPTMTLPGMMAFVLALLAGGFVLLRRRV